MAERPLTDQELERALRQVGAAVAFPPTPDLASAVQARLARSSLPPLPLGEGRGEGSFGEGSFPPRRLVVPRFALATAAALLAAVLVLTTFPEARTAVADVLGLRGVLISRVPAVVTGTPAPPLRLGEPLTLAEAQSRVPFRLLQPAALGTPSEVYFDPVPGGGQVALVYRGPILFTQFQAGLEPGFFAKGLGPDTHIELLTVNGGRAFWIEGRPHLFYYRDRDGQIRDESVRLAGNVLLWEQASLTLRLEANVPKDEAVRIASSVR
jgi:hypothetical protein